VAKETSATAGGDTHQRHRLGVLMFRGEEFSLLEKWLYKRRTCMKLFVQERKKVNKEKGGSRGRKMPWGPKLEGCSLNCNSQLTSTFTNSRPLYVVQPYPFSDICSLHIECPPTKLFHMLNMHPVPPLQQHPLTTSAATYAQQSQPCSLVGIATRSQTIPATYFSLVNAFTLNSQYT